MIEDIPRTLLADAFESWQKRLETRVENDGDYFEYMVSNHPSRFEFSWKEVG
jgi:hypothetical protein